MENIILKKMEEEIERLLDKLGTLTPGTGDYDAVVATLNNLYKSVNDQQTNVLDTKKLQFETAKVEVEKDIQVANTKEARLWNGVKTVVEVGSLAAPLVFYGIWMNRGLKFEEEGSFTSQTFKGLIGKFKPN